MHPSVDGLELWQLFVGGIITHRGLDCLTFHCSEGEGDLLHFLLGLESYKLANFLTERGVLGGGIMLTFSYSGF